MTAPQFSPSLVYWFDDAELGPTLAGKVEYRAPEKQLCFFTTERPRCVPALYAGEDVLGPRFDRGTDKGTVTVRVLTLADFERVFRNLTFQAPRFRDDAELQRFYVQRINEDPV